MLYKIPTVNNGMLCDDRQPGPSIQLDSPAWFAWLEAPTNTSFSYGLSNRTLGYIDGFMTVRKERRQRGGAYWTAYRRHGRRLRKFYLGRSSALTQALLEQFAARLHARDGPFRLATATPPTQPADLSDYLNTTWRNCRMEK